MAILVKQPHGGAINRFEKGDRNQKGRPPLLLEHINKQLRADGFKCVAPSQIAEAYELLFNLPQEKINQYILDKNCPMFFRIVAKAMVSTKGTEMLEKMLDRAHGKAKQTTELTGKDGNAIEVRTFTIIGAGNKDK